MEIIANRKRIDDDILILLDTSNLLSLGLAHGKKNDETKNDHDDEPDNDQSDGPSGEGEIARNGDGVDADDADGAAVCVLADGAEGVLVAVGDTEVGAEKIGGEAWNEGVPREPQAAGRGLACCVCGELDARIGDATLLVIPHTVHGV